MLWNDALEFKIQSSRFFVNFSSLPQLVGPLELHGQLSRVEIFTDVGQMLLQSQKRGSNVCLIGKSDVPPHGIRTARNARHLLRAAAAAGFQKWPHLRRMHQPTRLRVRLKSFEGDG